MRFKGYELRYRYDLTHRLPLPGDKDLNGEPLDDHTHNAHIIFTTVHRCLNEKNEFDRELVKTAKIIPLIYSRTNLGYGKLRENNRGMYFVNHDKEAILHPEFSGEIIQPGKEFHVCRYWSRPVYAALDGRVYTGTTYYYNKPKLYVGDIHNDSN